MHKLWSELLQGIPEGVYNSVLRLEDSFAIGTPVLKMITSHFMEELEKGSVHCVPVFFHPVETTAEA